MANIYRTGELAKLVDVKKETLFYYKEIELLLPKGEDSNGYWHYDDSSLKRLNKILLYREFGFTASEIKNFIDDPEFNEMEALSSKIDELKKEKEHIENLIGLAATATLTGTDIFTQLEYSKNIADEFGTELRAYPYFQEAINFDDNTQEELGNSFEECINKLLDGYGELNDEGRKQIVLEYEKALKNAYRHYQRNSLYGVYTLFKESTALRKQFAEVDALELCDYIGRSFYITWFDYVKQNVNPVIENLKELINSNAPEVDIQKEMDSLYESLKDHYYILNKKEMFEYCSDGGMIKENFDILKGEMKKYCEKEG